MEHKTTSTTVELTQTAEHKTTPTIIECCINNIWRELTQTVKEKLPRDRVCFLHRSPLSLMGYAPDEGPYDGFNSWSLEELKEAKTKGLRGNAYLIYLNDRLCPLSPRETWIIFRGRAFLHRADGGGNPEWSPAASEKLAEKMRQLAEFFKSLGDA